MRVLRCAALLLLLGLSSGALVSAAPGPRSESSLAEGRSALGPAHLFDRLWGFVTGVWRGAGCIIDPLGGCRTGTTGGGDVVAGCGMDPLGRCSTGTTGGGDAAEGCGIDPLGKPAPVSEEGCGMDPLGRCQPRP